MRGLCLSVYPNCCAYIGIRCLRRSLPVREWRSGSCLFPQLCLPNGMSAGDEILMRWLLAHGADPNVAHDRAPSALITAAVDEEGGDAVRLLLEHGAVLEPNILHYVIEAGAAMSDRTCRDRVEQLVRAGANINYIDPKRKGTPLHFAAWHYRGDVVEALIELGADPNIVFNGRTVVDVVKDEGQEFKPYLELYELLKEKTKVTVEEIDVGPKHGSDGSG